MKIRLGPVTVTGLFFISWPIYITFQSWIMTEKVVLLIYVFVLKTYEFQWGIL